MRRFRLGDPSEDWSSELPWLPAMHQARDGKTRLYSAKDDIVIKPPGRSEKAGGLLLSQLGVLGKYV